MASSAAMRWLVLFALLVGLGSDVAAGDPARGKLIFALAGGCGCHTPTEGPVGAGGRALPTPFGTFYGTNITPDAETGLGRWSDGEIIAAIREGVARGKGVEAPVMPYYLYAGMSDADVSDLVAYLRELPPVRRTNREPEVSIPLPRLGYRAWRWLFAPVTQPAPEAPAAGVERGRYLADHVAICTDCHTPRSRFGALDSRMYLAGTRHGPDGKAVPNITPDADTGLGNWDLDDLTEVLVTGMLPNFDNVQGLMGEVVDGVGGGAGYAAAPRQDLEAIARYLKAVRPVYNAVKD